MRIKKNKSSKLKWEKPQMLKLPFKNTFGGTTQSPYIESTAGPTYS